MRIHAIKDDESELYFQISKSKKAEQLIIDIVRLLQVNTSPIIWEKFFKYDGHQEGPLKNNHYGSVLINGHDFSVITTPKRVYIIIKKKKFSSKIKQRIKDLVLKDHEFKPPKKINEEF